LSEVARRFRLHNLDRCPVAESQLPIWQRMQAALRQGPLTPIALAEALGDEVDTITRTARRMHLFRVIPGGDSQSEAKDPRSA
jgi:hypothetical protein